MCNYVTVVVSYWFAVNCCVCVRKFNLKWKYKQTNTDLPFGKFNVKTQFCMRTWRYKVISKDVHNRLFIRCVFIQQERSWGYLLSHPLIWTQFVGLHNFMMYFSSKLLKKSSGKYCSSKKKLSKIRSSLFDRRYMMFTTNKHKTGI